MSSNLIKSRLEELIEEVLADVPGEARHVREYDARGTRVVVLGGGTGLSTVVGGDSQLPGWVEQPFVGLKQVFPFLGVVVCTTDDGGSTGLLLKQLPFIGIGDLRKSCLSLIRRDNIRRIYDLEVNEVHAFVNLVQRIFNYRFSAKVSSDKYLRDPLRVLPQSLRKKCPPTLAKLLRRLGSSLCKDGTGPTINPAGHCLGNLLLTAAILQEAGGRTDVAPGLAALRKGVDRLSQAIGVSRGTLQAATNIPGQLRFKYTHGVEVLGQVKSAKSPRGFPVEQVFAEYVVRPVVSSVISSAIEKADLIIYAPGSLYSSMIPVIQLEPIARSIRKNKKALKILGANFWVQEGETDIAPDDLQRGFLVSELIEAYDRNVIGGAKGLFNVVLGADLEQMPASILRNYALEGKRPIHLDREKVEEMGLQTVEATVFSKDRLYSGGVIHHDPENFSLAVKTLLYSQRNHSNLLAKARESKQLWQPPKSTRHAHLLPQLQHNIIVPCDHMKAIEKQLENKTFRPAKLRKLTRTLAWENRDISPDHLNYINGIRLVPAAKWLRSMEWDRVCGYYDPVTKFIKLHSQLSQDQRLLRENLLIALGQSLLGVYIERRSMLRNREDDPYCRTYEILLYPKKHRFSYLSDKQLHQYLELCHMVRSADNKLLYRTTVNRDQSFLPPGLLFGMLYAWYLDRQYVHSLDYEMSLLHWPKPHLTKHHTSEFERKRKLIEFFRTEVFGYEQ